MEATATTDTASETASVQERGAPTAIAEPHMGAWDALVSAHASMTGRLQDALTAAGLPPLAWYQVLSAVASAPDERVRMGELAEALIITRGGLTKLIDRLVKAGLLERAFCESDRRVSYAVLLEAGREMLAEMRPVVAAELERAFVTTLDADQAEALRSALERVTSSACSS